MRLSIPNKEKESNVSVRNKIIQNTVWIKKVCGGNVTYPYGYECEKFILK